MNTLKNLARNCKATRAIDYKSDNEVILAVDSSWIAVGYVLSQIGDNGRCYPSRYGSVTWNDHEKRYLQARLELYGLFRALRHVKVWIVGVKNLVVEVDTKYIQGMINNPDIQPNVAMNRWIAGILLFDFKLRHVPAKDHAAPNGLSRRPQAPEDVQDDDNPEDWIDKANCFTVELANSYQVNLVACAQEIVIPQSPNVQIQDQRLEAIRIFLDNLERPDGLSEKDYKLFVKRASQFFLKDGRL